LAVSASGVYYLCVNAINCTGKNTSKDLLLALGEADANMYLCSKELRPSENKFLYFISVRILLSLPYKLLFEKTYRMQLQ